MKQKKKWRLVFFALPESRLNLPSVIAPPSCEMYSSGQKKFTFALRATEFVNHSVGAGRLFNLENGL